MMKLLYSIFLLLPALLYSQARTADELRKAGLKKYEFERGRISYEITGGAEGAEDMVFDQYGWKSFRKQTMVFELYNVNTVQTIHEIRDGDFVYRLNEGDSTMSTRRDLKWSQQAAYKDPGAASESILFSIGGTFAGDSTFLDRTCQVWTFDSKVLRELWVWKGLVLKRKTKLADQLIVTSATSVEIGLQTDQTLFEIPPYMRNKK